MVAIPQAAITAAKDSISFLGTDRFCSIFYAHGEWKLLPNVPLFAKALSSDSGNLRSPCYSAFSTTDRAVSNR